MSYTVDSLKGVMGDCWKEGESYICYTPKTAASKEKDGWVYVCQIPDLNPNVSPGSSLRVLRPPEGPSPEQVEADRLAVIAETRKKERGLLEKKAAEAKQAEKLAAQEAKVAARSQPTPLDTLSEPASPVLTGDSGGETDDRSRVSPTSEGDPK